MRSLSIALVAATLATGLLTAAPANAAEATPHVPANAPACSATAPTDFVVEVIPSPYPTFQSEQDRVMRKIRRAGYVVEPVGNDHVLVHGVTSLTPVWNVLGSDRSVAGVEAFCLAGTAPADWVVTVTPSPYPTIQSERDRVMRRAVRAGYQAEPLGKDQFVMHGVTTLVSVRSVLGDDDSVAAVAPAGASVTR